MYFTTLGVSLRWLLFLFQEGIARPDLNSLFVVYILFSTLLSQIPYKTR